MDITAIVLAGRGPIEQPGAGGNRCRAGPVGDPEGLGTCLFPDRRGPSGTSDVRSLWI